MTPCCILYQILLLQNAVGSQILPLYDIAGSQFLPLHDAMFFYAGVVRLVSVQSLDKHYVVCLTSDSEDLSKIAVLCASLLKQVKKGLLRLKKTVLNKLLHTCGLQL